MFYIYEQDVCLGTTELESGDPPMGIAYGMVKITEHYQPAFRLSAHLVVKTEQNTVIPCQQVVLEDFSAEAGVICVQVTLLAVPYPLYQQLFPKLVAMYSQT